MAKKEYIPQQIFITQEAKHDLNVVLAKFDMLQKTFVEEMLQHFYDKQQDIHARDSFFAYPQSVSRGEPKKRVFQMKFTKDMKDKLTHCLEEARSFDSEEVSERRVLMAMFEEYLTIMKKRKS
ncbi:hypothetical protein M2404_003876 [Rheinheimera pacifica]|uniref:hypothetical protein n=1 Tax=Rheinheimera pacifica TaxID=173990 RepID=UPI0021670342|nr:hypothetical protein [Rheinheimera pacifica]MCS4309504.1 hypothetical protein [Rheinheimera pacifica]